MSYHLSDSRLLAVAGFVRAGSVVADIGADHGHLIGYLVKNDICLRGYACDVAEGPLARTRETIRELGLGNRVETVLTNGLIGLPLDEIDDIVIAGMGGELIAEILAACPGAKDRRLRFILQPMTKAERLRRLLYRMGFALLEEHGAREGNHVYTAMAAGYTGVPREVDELFAWTGLLPGSDRPESLMMLRKVRGQLEDIADGLDHSERLAASSAHYRGLIAEIGTFLPEETP